MDDIMKTWRSFVASMFIVSEVAIPTGCEINTNCNCVDSSETPLSISQVQNILKDNGYGKYMEEVTFASGIADGICGDETRSAILAFQKDTGIECDGCVGDETHGKINQIIGS